MARTDLSSIDSMAAGHRLAVFGGFHPTQGDDCPESTGTILLLGPSEPGFWAHVTTMPEWQDGAPDPLDRWSKRVLADIAFIHGGEAIFPSDGPPYPPFYRWALRTERVWASPVQLLVHDRAGLMVSFRGALALPDRLDLPPPPAASPCETCTERPCEAACPSGALTPEGYDVPSCHDFLDTPSGQDCLSSGCRVRRACPLSQAYGRLPEQSAYHMRLFHK
ncbi:ferredoxin [Defluviimonas sp. WL0050]|uniref:Ferredoxin n=1 Tax=Albidovulum litorale TaxID=2984134 RepID=A0ABT2ZLK6_9RHOB|nr:ferredoxin [Defluviimonas sp. WL0050]MCV2872004.1 ferredoxin [Defluviimonas sp. WL0050]